MNRKRDSAAGIHHEEAAVLDTKRKQSIVELSENTTGE